MQNEDKVYQLTEFPSFHIPLKYGALHMDDGWNGKNIPDLEKLADQWHDQM
jgi:hypothetical protein